MIKELLNNIVKHAQATEVIISLKIESGYLVLTIQDNGIGINTENIRKLGNGIKNIKKRMADMQLDFSIENNHGTIAILRDKLHS